MSQTKITRKHFMQTVGAAVGAAAGGSMIAAPAIISSGCGLRRSDIIRTENAKPGTTDWILTKVHQREHETQQNGWDVRTEVQGYASHLSVRVGGNIKLHVSAEPADDYKIDIYRMGYYGGAGGRLVRTIDGLHGTPQPTPAEEDHSAINCQWEEAVSLDIPEDWVSGVYLCKLSTKNTDGEAYIIFVVRDDRQADLLFQCSDYTWISYNRWPKWRSLYDTPRGPWGAGSPDAYNAGFSRPYGIFYNLLPANWEAQTNGSGEFLLWEHPLAFWLEKEGYDVTYISNQDTHEDGPGLLRGKVFLSVGHDEYWTQELFDNVKRARDAGVNLAFLCGNSVSGRIELRSDRRGRPYRSMRLINRALDEVELMGSRSYGVGLGDWTCTNPKHWVFEGTNMQEGESISQLVGWEFHGPPVSDHHKDFEILAQGPVSRSNGVIIPNRSYAATIFTAPKGNYVFNAATCWWNMPLSAPPGMIKPPRHDFTQGDERVRRITTNVLKRMLSVKI